MSTPYSKYAAQRGERTRPQRIEAKPLRHPGRWVLAAVLVGLPLGTMVGFLTVSRLTTRIGLKAAMSRKAGR